MSETKGRSSGASASSGGFPVFLPVPLPPPKLKRMPTRTHAVANAMTWGDLRDEATEGDEKNDCEDLFNEHDDKNSSSAPEEMVPVGSNDDVTVALSPDDVTGANGENTPSPKHTEKSWQKMMLGLVIRGLQAIEGANTSKTENAPPPTVTEQVTDSDSSGTHDSMPSLVNTTPSLVNTTSTGLPPDDTTPPESLSDDWPHGFDQVPTFHNLHNMLPTFPLIHDGSPSWERRIYGPNCHPKSPPPVLPPPPPLRHTYALPKAPPGLPSRGTEEAPESIYQVAIRAISQEFLQMHNISQHGSPDAQFLHSSDVAEAVNEADVALSSAMAFSSAVALSPDVPGAEVDQRLHHDRPWDWRNKKLFEPIVKQPAVGGMVPWDDWSPYHNDIAKNVHWEKYDKETGKWMKLNDELNQKIKWWTQMENETGPFENKTIYNSPWWIDMSHLRMTNNICDNSAYIYIREVKTTVVLEGQDSVPDDYAGNEIEFHPELGDLQWQWESSNDGWESKWENMSDQMHCQCVEATGHEEITHPQVFFEYLWRSLDGYNRRTKYLMDFDTFEQTNTDNNETHRIRLVAFTVQRNGGPYNANAGKGSQAGSASQ